MHRFPSELLAGAADSYELTECRAYEQIDGPIGPQRGDRRAHAIALAACGGKVSAVQELLDFGTQEEQEEHTLIELPPEEKAAHAMALLGKFELIVGGPPDGHGR